MTAMTRHAHARVLAALFALVLAACGTSSDGAGDADEPWPLRVDLPGVLGYVAIDVRPGELDRLFDEFAGVPLGGLAAEGRLVALHLDETTHGGGQALVVPLADPAAVRAFLESPDGGVERLDDQRVRVTVPPGAGLARAFKLMETVARGPQSGISGMASGIAAMMDGNAPLVLTMHVGVDDRNLLLAPSFEGLAVARGTRDRVPGLSREPDDDERLVAVFDVERIGTAYHDQIQATRNQLRALFSAAPAAGFGAMMMGMRDRGAGPSMPRIAPDVLDALLRMFDAIDVDGLRLDARRGPASLTEMSRDGELGEFVASPIRATVAVPDDALVTTMRPAPDVPGAEWTLAADADAFAAAAAAWCAPLAVAKHGRGAPADEAVARLEEFLAGWGGVLAAGVDDVLVVTTDPTTGLDISGLVAWFEPILDKIGDDDGPRLVRAAEGGWRVVSSEGDVVGTIEPLGEQALWFGEADRAAPPLDGVEAVLRARAPDAGPWQRIAFEGDDGTSMLAEFVGRPGAFDVELVWDAP